MENFINSIASINTIPEAIIVGSVIIGIFIVIHGIIN